MRGRGARSYRARGSVKASPAPGQPNWTEPLRFKRLTSPHPPPCAQPPGLSPVPLAAHPRDGRPARSRVILLRGSEEDKSCTISVLVGAAMGATLMGTPGALIGGLFPKRGSAERPRE